MSYNIDSIEIINSDGFSIHRDEPEKLREEFENETWPESCVLDDDWDGFVEVDDELQVAGFWWCGEGSGYTEDLLIEHVLPRFSGSADLLVTWEGGDSHSGLRLRDGVVTSHEVVFSLGEEVD